MVASKEWNIPWHLWSFVPQVRRAQMVAFEAHMNLRESYVSNHMLKKGKDDGKGSTYEAMQKTFER